MEITCDGSLYSARIRRHCRRIWAAVRPGKSGGRGILRKTAAPYFPLIFFLRNAQTLHKEFQASKIPLRTQRIRMAHLLRERVSSFHRIGRWVEGGGENGLGGFKIPVVADPSSPYCDHCGGCCEIPGGMPEFPEESRLPAKGREWFENGLGPGHRFCPFLCECRETGRGFCSIYPWRPNPCRIFDHEECAVVKNDPDFVSSCRPQELLETCQWLSRLLNGR